MKAVYLGTNHGFAVPMYRAELARAFTAAGWRLALPSEPATATSALRAGAIAIADLVVVLLDGSRSVHVELGIALGAGKPTVVVETRQAAGYAFEGTFCPYYLHPLVKFLAVQFERPSPHRVIETAEEWLRAPRGRQGGPAAGAAAADEVVVHLEEGHDAG